MNELSTSVGFLESCWHYLVLGIIQGLTEFLPISSTAHLKVLPVLWGWGDPGVSVIATIQLGSIIAVILYFYSDIREIFLGIGRAANNGNWQDPYARLGIAIFLGTLPIFFLGLLIKLFWSSYEASPFRSIPSIAIVSIVMALLLAIAEKSGHRTKSLKDVKGRDGFIVGLGQVFALIPGVSRSGSTLTASLFNGWRREDAARFSFLLGIPAIAIAGLVEFANALKVMGELGFIPLLFGITSAGVISWIAIDWLLKYLQQNKTWVFVVYRLFFGILLLISWSH